MPVRGQFANFVFALHGPVRSSAAVLRAAHHQAPSQWLDIQKVHSFPVHMKKKAPQTEAVGPSYPPNTSKNLSLTLGPGQKIDPSGV